MVSKFTQWARTAAVSIVLGAAPAAWSGTATPPGVIEYHPMGGGVAAVPTLGQWSLILLGLLIAVIAYRVLRERIGGQLLAYLVLAGGLVVGGWAGGDLIDMAKAVSGPHHVELDNPGGGEAPVLFTGESEVKNVSGVSQQIKRKLNFEYYTWGTPSGKPCEDGQELPDEAVCNVLLVVEPDD